MNGMWDGGVALSRASFWTGWPSLMGAIDITTVLQDFADYWTPFLGQQVAAPTYLMSVDVQTQE